MYNNSTAPLCNNVTSCASRGGPQIPGDVVALLTLRVYLVPVLTAIGFASLAVSLFGNVLFTWVMVSDKRLRSMAQFFLVNVAVADAVYAALNIVGEAASLILSPEAMLRAFCTLYRPLIAVRFVAYGISVLCLASLSVERCIAICAPVRFHSHGTAKNKLKLGLVAALWLSATALSAPLGFCSEVSKLHVVVLAVVLHAIPLVVISAANLKIIILLCKPEQADLRSTAQRDTGGLFKLLVLLIVSFLMFWSPYHAMFLYHTFQHRLAMPLEAQLKWGFALHAGNILTYFNSALHCILYFALCQSFRRGLRALVSRCAPRWPLGRGHASFSAPQITEQVECRGITNISQC